MNLPLFISKRIANKGVKSFSSTIYKIAVASIGLSLATMIVTFSISLGFRGVIEEKIFSFGAHLEISKFNFGSTFPINPISTEQDFYTKPEQFGFIDHIQSFGYKPGVLKTEEMMGMVMKGVDRDFNLERFKPNIKSGDFIQFNDSTYSQQIMISQLVADKLQVAVGDRVTAHFFQDPPRVRRLTVIGIYETWIENFDNKIALVDIGLIRRLNDWQDTQVGGFEVFIKDFNMLDDNENILYDELPSDLYVEKITSKYQEVFEWLGLVKQNMLIFLGLVLFVAAFNMISIIFILVVERTQMIGLFKALGASNQLVRRIFAYHGIILVLKGMLIGNVLGIGLSWLQDKFRIVTLDAANYYMSYVPIEWNWRIVIILNIVVFTSISLVILIMALIVYAIKPIKAIKFA